MGNQSSGIVLNSKFEAMLIGTEVMQTIMIRIALMLCLMKLAFAYTMPINKYSDGQEDEGKNIIANDLVGINRQSECKQEGDDCPWGPSTCCGNRNLTCGYPDGKGIWNFWSLLDLLNFWNLFPFQSFPVCYVPER